MTTNFPTSLDSLTNPTANDPLNSPTVPHADQHANANDAIEALQAAVGVTNSSVQTSLQYRVGAVETLATTANGTANSAEATANAAMPATTTALGTLVYGATAKTTPVDADVLPLADSAAANVAKKLSWLSLRTELASIFSTPSSVASQISTFAPAETTTTIGTLVSGATAKTTPVDADTLALSDSAASNVIKKLSWANLKSSLASTFARLAGTAGGQTIYGGTAASESLTLRSTSHATKGTVILGTSSAYDEVNARLGIGTTAPSAKVHSLATTEQLRIGYDASNYLAATVSSTGTVTIDATGGQYTFKHPASSGIATIGSELVTNGGFPSDLSSWTDSGSSWSWSSGTALHTAGSASTLSQNVSVTAGSTYCITFTVSGRTAGDVSIAVGVDQIVNYSGWTTFNSNSTVNRAFTATNTGSVTLVITPSSTFDGKLDDISLKLVTASSATSVISAIDSGGNATAQLSANNSLSNIGLGTSALKSIYTGNFNSSFGVSAGQYLICGGSNALFGWAAGRSLQNGYRNCIFGRSAGYYLKDPTSTVTIGAYAATYLANGSSQATGVVNGVYIGDSTKLSADNVTNENVFGYNATGSGSNSTTIGSSAVTKCVIYGDITLDKTITAAGTTGAQTINKTCGSVNFAASATSLVVTDSRVTATSVIIATVGTNDTTMKTVSAVAAAGSFTLYANAAATAETRVNFLVIN